MTWYWFILAYLLMEVLINFVFHFINGWLKENDQPATNRKREVFKGVLERIFLISGILAGYPHVIIAFGALKIGTRFQKNNKVSNDYFLIGNFMSLLAALLFVICIKTI